MENTVFLCQGDGGSSTGNKNEEKTVCWKMNWVKRIFMGCRLKKLRWGWVVCRGKMHLKGGGGDDRYVYLPLYYYPVRMCGANRNVYKLLQEP